MESIVRISDPPHSDQRRAGGTVAGSIPGNDLKDQLWLTNFVSILAKCFFGIFIPALVGEAGDVPLESIGEDQHEDVRNVRMVLSVDHHTVILDLYTICWDYQLAGQEFFDYLFEHMKPAFLELFESHEFDGIYSDPEKWYEMMLLGVFLLDNQRD